MDSKTRFHLFVGGSLLLLIILCVVAALTGGVHFVSIDANTGQITEYPTPQAPESKVARQPVSWSEHGIIDIHAHIGTFRGFDLSLATLLNNIQRYSVRLALISNIDGAELPGTTQNLDEIVANRATADVVRQYPDKFRGLLWTRPEDGSPEKVAPFLLDQGMQQGDPRVFVGLKFHPDMNHFAADDKRVDGYLQLCEKYEVPAVFHAGAIGSNSDPARIYAVARRHPKVPVILYHMGFGGDHGNAIQVAKESLTRKDALLYLETAQATPDTVLRAVKELGADRILFGTDATYFGRDHYAQYDRLVGMLKNELSAEDFTNVVRSNAERVFHLK